MNTELLRNTTDPEESWPELLRRAKAGDEDAHRRVALAVFCKYEYRVRRLNTVDPATDYEDLQITFFEGCMRNVLIADGRGDDFYHIGQRAIWYVLSKLRVLQRMLKRRATKTEARAATDPDGLDLFNVEDPCIEDFREIVHERVGAEQLTRVIANTSLRGREAQAVELILSGSVGDPRDAGLGKRLAEAMDVSPQRASQVMASLRKGLES